MNTCTKRSTEEIDTAYELFGQHLSLFRQSLITQKYAGATIQAYIRCIGVLAWMMKNKRIAVEDLDEILALKLITKTGWAKQRKNHLAFITIRFVRFLNEHGVGKPTVKTQPAQAVWAELRGDYETYLRQQRGLSESTIDYCWYHAMQFLKFRFGGKTGDLSKITATDITDFMTQLATRTPPARNKTLSSHLRNFFRYLFQNNLITLNLAMGIPSVAQRYGARLPRHLNPEHVERLIEAVRKDKNSGWRNYAMVLLLARLGLRPPEVIAMQIDDIDWRSGEIIVRGKGNRHDRLPLLPDVGAALADYIRLERVTDSRTLFVTERAPRRPFKDSQILNAILKDAFAKTGLTVPAPYVGAHILRHSLATHLVQHGASLEEISNTLRHRSRSTTLLYVRLDIDGLRSVAQPWPAAGGAK
jgi:site-specific recombinase XerD